MSKLLTIEPVTRVEGHGKITLEVKDGRLSGARLNVVEFRGFEKFCQGALAELMPQLTARVCGICPVSHMSASVKAVEHAFGVTIPETAARLRRLHILGQFIESHTLSLAVLSLPDLAFAGASAEKRNLVHLGASQPQLVRTALALRKAGTTLCQVLGRRDGIPVGARPGGVVQPLSETERVELLQCMEQACQDALSLRESLHAIFLEQLELLTSLGEVRTPFMGSLSADGFLDPYDGELTIVGPDLAPDRRFPSTSYFDHFSETAVDWSYMKFPELKDGRSVRVAPLARIHVAGKMRSEEAQQELEWFKQTMGWPAHGSLLNHAARYIEILEALGCSRATLADPTLTAPEVCVPVTPRAGTGVGVVEAPRGTLVHQYTFDAEGKVEKANLIVATAHNNQAINDALSQAARSIPGLEPSESELNHLEMIVRAYDPCLSCATHAHGQRPFAIELVDEQGSFVKQLA